MKQFFDYVREHLFRGSLMQGEVDGMNKILDRTLGLHVEVRAYLLATAYVETGYTMQPVREAFGTSDADSIRRLDRAWEQGKLKWVSQPYWRDGWFGRGFVQLTHEDNYKRAGKALGVDLAGKPELALDMDISVEILVRGCLEGWFTRGVHQLGDFVPGDYVGARKVVNGTDRAHEIAGYARHFESALRAAGAAVVTASDTAETVPPAPVSPLPESPVPVDPAPPVTPDPTPADIVPDIVRQGLKWSPIAKLRVAGIGGALATLGSGGLAAFLTEYGFADIGITEAMVYTALGTGVTWLSGYFKKEEPIDQLKGVKE